MDPIECVNALEQAASRARLAWILVIFEDRTELVQYRPQEREGCVAELEALLDAGGCPFGVVSCFEITGVLRFTIQPFQESVERDWTDRYLQSAANVLLDRAAALGLRGHIDQPERN
jgi:hypothetical protein